MRGDVRSVALILAAGEGRRLGASEPKAFIEIGGRTILSIAAAAAAASPAVDALVITVPESFEARAMEILAPIAKASTVVTGGLTRHASVRTALALVPGSASKVACHDAARPFVPPDMFTAVLDALDRGCDGVVPVLAVTDTVKRIADGLVTGTESRAELGLAQTPQAFHLEPFREAHERAEAERLDFTDDASVLEWAGYRVCVVAGEPMNFKITTLGDLARAQEMMAGDVHG